VSFTNKINTTTGFVPAQRTHQVVLRCIITYQNTDKLEFQRHIKIPIFYILNFEIDQSIDFFIMLKVSRNKKYHDAFRFG
jgi:hypothetical protein